jgi:hypothetical protein
MMQAHLRLPKEMRDDKKEQYVDGIIKRLGLAKAADTIVGDAKTRGLSGGPTGCGCMPGTACSSATAWLAGCPGSPPAFPHISF